MGYWYWRNLKNAWNLDHGTSDRFDLPERGMLSGLMLKIQNKNNLELVNVNLPYPMQKITFRIVANGNVEIVDIKGSHLQALNFWDRGMMPWDSVRVLDNEGNENYSFIPFGRELGDEKYGLDLSKFDAGVQFEETNTMNDTLYTENYSKLTVYGLFRKDPEAGLFGGGYLKKRQILNRTTTGATQHSVKLPTRNKIRQISLFSEMTQAAGLPTYGPFAVLNTLWLGLKSKEEYLLNSIPADQFARFIHHFYKRKPETKIRCRTGMSADKIIDTMIYEREDSLMSPNFGGTGYFVQFDTSAMYERFVKPTGYNASGSGVNVNIYLRSQGILYHGHIPLLMGDMMGDEEGWLDAEEEKDVYVEWSEGGSYGNIYVVLDELQKTYPV